MADRHAISLQYAQMTDQWLQTSSVARHGNHRMGPKTGSIDEHHVRAVKTLHFGNDGCDSALERRDESVIDGWIGTAMPIASVWTFGVGEYQSGGVPESEPLRNREGGSVP